MALSIGEVAKASGVAARTIRYYEQVGVLPSPSRTLSGYRQYNERSIQHLVFLRRARALGLPLHRLKPLIAVLNGGSPGALRPRLLDLVRGHLSTVRQQLGELHLLERQLEQALRRRVDPSQERTGGCRCLDGVTARPTRQSVRVLRGVDGRR
jgi:DNA-binding transcriptional MerR regulator